MDLIVNIRRWILYGDRELSQIIEKIGGKNVFMDWVLGQRMSGYFEKLFNIKIDFLQIQMIILFPN